MYVRVERDSDRLNLPSAIFTQNMWNTADFDHFYQADGTDTTKVEAPGVFFILNNKKKMTVISKQRVYSWHHTPNWSACVFLWTKGDQLWMMLSILSYTM